MKKIFQSVIWFMLVVGLLTMVLPVFAQEPLPPTPVAGAAPSIDLGVVQPILDWIWNVVLVGVVLIVAGVAGERGTEVITAILRKVGEFSGFKFLALHGWGAALLALLVAAIGVFSPTFNLQFFQQFELFKAVSPMLVGILNTLLLWAMQNYLNRSRVTSFMGGMATPYANLKFRDLKGLLTAKKS